MNAEEEIKRIQEELEALKETHLQQREQIRQLNQRFHQLTANKYVPEKPAAREGVENLSLENFIGLKVMHLIGIIVLVAGLSIGVKYAIDRDLISELTRILLAYLSGFILFIISFRLKKKFVLFSAILFSGGMATLYFTTYGAHVYYNMMSFGLAFGLMVALTIYTVYEANRYNRQEIALLGLVGAYAIPFLISRNQENATLYFLYITLINAGVLFLCIKKSWKLVGKLAQHITWILFIFWAGMRYSVAYQLTGYVFPVIFFLMFFLVAVSNNMYRKSQLSVNEVSQVILNTLSFFLAAMMIWSGGILAGKYAHVAVVFSLISLLQAYVLKKLGEKYAWISLATLSYLFLIAFTAMQWEGMTVTLLWLLIAMISFGFGIMARIQRARMAAILLAGATLFKLVVFDSARFNTIQKVISYIALGILLLVTSYYYQKLKDKFIDPETE